MWWRRRRALKELDEDLRDHIAQETEEGVARGMTPAEARRQALVTFGNLAVTQEDVRDVWTFPGSRTISDARAVLQTLRRSPSYAVGGISIIGISLTLLITVFAVSDGILYRPLPYSQPDQLYVVARIDQTGSAIYSNARPANIERWRSTLPGLALGIFTNPMTVGRLSGGQELRLTGAAINWEFLQVLQIVPDRGGLSRADFTGSDGARPGLISHALWHNLFNARPEVVGETMQFSFPAHARPIRVAGVLPKNFAFPSWERGADVLLPFSAFDPRLELGIHTAVARVSSTVELPRLEALLNGPLSSQPQPEGRSGFALVSLRDALTAQHRSTLSAVNAASLVLVLLGCLNLAGITAARSHDRLRETALRRALGATTWTIARLSFLETAALAFCGVLMAVLLAPLFLRVTLELLPTNVGLLKAPRIDLRVLILAAASAVIVTFLVGIWPVRVATGRTLWPMIQVLRGSSPAQGQRLRWLIAVQTAVGFGLVLGGGWYVRNMAQVWPQDPGYETANVIAIKASFDGRASRESQLATLRETLASVPGVSAVGTFDGPFLERRSRADLGWAKVAGSMGGCLAGPKLGIGPGFFEVMQLRFRKGRVLSDDEIIAGTPLAIISETTAARCWPNQDPLGATFTIAASPFTVIGVVQDARFRAADESAQGEVYVPQGAIPHYVEFVAVARTLPAADNVERRIIEYFKERGVYGMVQDVFPLERALFETIRIRAFNAWLFGAFGVLGAFILATGVFAITLIASSRKQREIGIRYALGSTRGAVLIAIIREQMVAVAVGLLVGLAGIIAYGVSGAGARGTPVDTALYVVVVLIIGLVGLGGALLPAVWASRVDPITSLREL
jgi:predicted permease